MDVVSTDAMLHEANISTNSARIINWHITQFLEDLFLPLKQSAGNTLAILILHQL